MPYSPTTWVDGVTPVNAANLNKLEVGLQNAVGVPADTVVAFNAFLLRNELSAPDTQPAFRLMGDGKLEWGPGGSTAPDTTIYRWGVGMLRTNTWMVASIFASEPDSAGESYAFTAKFQGDTTSRFIIARSGKLDWGPGGSAASDTTLYRTGVNTLFTPGTLASGGAMQPNGLVIQGGAEVYAGNAKWFINPDGAHQWGPGDWTRDTTLLRTGVGELTVQGGLVATGASSYGGITGMVGLYYRPATAVGYPIASKVGAEANSRFYVSVVGQIEWGAGTTATDTNLYRAAADLLRTDDTFVAGRGFLSYAGSTGSAVTAFMSDLMSATGYYLLGRRTSDTAWRFGVYNDGKLEWGDGTAAPDTNLYRSSADKLMTDDTFIIGQYLDIRAGNTNAVAIYVSNLPADGSGLILAAHRSGDTTGWRYIIDSDGKMQWGPGGAIAGDTTLYRALAGYLKTDANFIASGGVFVGNSGDGTTYTQGVIFGVSQDTRLYRSGSGELKTDGHLVVGQQLQSFKSGAGQIALSTSTGIATGNPCIYFGGSSDTTLERPASGVLKTSGGYADAAIGTALPASPVDGQMFTLVDSLTAPTYAWQFKYVSGIADAYKWVFIGGSAVLTEVLALEAASATSYGNLTTPGPSFTLPRNGIYEIGLGFRGSPNAPAGGSEGTFGYMAPQTPGHAAVDNEALMSGNANGGSPIMGGTHAREQRLTLLASALTAVYKTASGTTTKAFSHRWLRVLPVRIS